MLADPTRCRGEVVARGTWLRSGAALVLIVTSAAVLLDWGGHFIDMRARQIPFATMKANTALCFLAVGLGVFLLRRDRSDQKSPSIRNQIALGLGCSASLLALLTLAQYIMGISFGLDELLVSDPYTPADQHPGRMAVATAVALATGGAALALLGSATPERRSSPERVKIAHLLAVGPALVGYLSLAGYAYNFTALYSFRPFSSVSPFTALDSALLSACLLSSLPELGWSGALVAHPGSRQALIRTLPFVVLAPLLIGVPISFGAQLRLYPSELAPAFFALATAIFTFTLNVYQINQFRREAGRLLTSERAFRDADPRKDDYLAVLAHELRNALTPLRNGIFTLARSGLREPHAVRLLSIMEPQIAQLVRLVDDLFDACSISLGKLRLKKEHCALDAIFRQAIANSEPLIQAKQQQLETNLPSTPVMLEADAIRLTQVFTNLLVNAAKYTQEGGSIWLRAVHSDREVTVSISDNGRGISENLLPNIFGLFAQGHGGSAGRENVGLGVGLAVVRWLVEEHGGSVEARSDGPSRGSEFIVRLPVTA
jgi:signal transduction histidine kinase